MGWRRKALIVSPIVSLLIYLVLLRPFLPEPEIGAWGEVALACVVGWHGQCLREEDNG